MTGVSNHPFPVKYITLSNGCKTAYIDEGTGGKTLLFVHGLATYAFSWWKNIGQLKQHYRCIAIDLPGNGFSERGDLPYGIDFFSGCVYDFIKKMQLQHVTLVGHSMGGQVAMNLAINDPSCADKLVLCAPAGFEVFTSFENTLYRSAIGIFDFFSSEENSLRKILQASFYRHGQQGDEMVEDLVHIMRSHSVQQFRNMIDACIHGMLNEPVYDRLHLIKQPTLILFGEHDALIPNRFIHHTTTRRMAEEAAKRIPGAVLHVLPQCGHFLQIEKATEVNEYIHRFVES
jgi:pimeloyl-ACP methyl ester carboxylesterase